MKTFRLNHRVTFFSYNSNYAKADANDLSGNVVTINVTKEYERGAGRWQINFTFQPDKKTGKRLDEILAPNDMCLIELDAGDGRGLVPVMRGLVDRVARTVSINGDGAPQHRVKVSGSDMGKILLKHDIGWDISVVHGDLSVVGGKVAVRTIRTDAMVISGTPGEVVQSIFNKYVVGGTAFDLDPVIAKWLNLEIDGADNWLMKNSEILTEVGSAWEVMMRYANIPINVLYTETDNNGDFYVYHEKRPLDSNGDIAAETPVNIIDDRLIVYEDIGVSDEDRVNYFFYKVPLLTVQSEQNRIPFFATAEGGKDTLIYSDDPEIRRNGLSQHSADTIYIPIGQENLNQECGTRAKAIWEWYRYNHTLLNGTYVVHGMPEISVGEALLHAETRGKFLIEGYSHAYSVHPVPSFTTTIECTRGKVQKR